MILSILQIQDEHKTYKKDNLAFDYRTPEQFKELDIKDEDIYGEINIQKPYEKSYTEEYEWKNCDVVSIPDEKNEYHRYFEIFKAKKRHKGKAIGYLEVNVDGERYYLRVLDGKSMIILLPLLFGVILLAGLLAVPKFGTGGKDTVTQPTLEVAEGSEWNGALPERFQEETDFQENIEIAGYTNLLVTDAHQQIDLINTDKNTVYQQYRVYLDGKELFDSKLIAPGKMVAWNAYNELEAGHYQLEFQISTYDLETQAPCNGATQAVSLDVEKV